VLQTIQKGRLRQPSAELAGIHCVVKAMSIHASTLLELFAIMLFQSAAEVAGSAFCPALGPLTSPPKVVAAGLTFTLSAPVLHNGQKVASMNLTELNGLPWKVKVVHDGNEICSGTVDLLDFGQENPGFVETLRFPCVLAYGDGNRDLVLQLMLPSWCGHITGESTSGGGAINGSRAFSIHVNPGWLTLFPVILTIALALITKEVYSSMFLGLWLGSFLVNSFNPVGGLLRVLDQYLPDAIASSFNRQLMLFSLSMAGFSTLINKSGGVKGFAKCISKIATTSARAQLAGWLLGVAIFIDDYSNCLIVGSTLVPIMDKFKVTRAKLAFIVDCTSAPIASIAPVSAWIGYEVGLIKTEFDALGITESPFMAFLSTIPMRFYPFGMLCMGFAVIWWQRDFGPMYTLEAQLRGTARRRKAEEAEENNVNVGDTFDPVGPSNDRKFGGAKACAHLAIVPIVFLVGTVCVGLPLSGYYELRDSGADYDLKDLVGASTPAKVLVWAGFVGLCVNLVLIRSHRIMSLDAILLSWVHGMKLFLPPIIILLHAWGIGAVVKELMMPQYVVVALGGSIPKEILPMIVFVLAAVISFATGTSWGTMAALFPVVVPLAWKVGGQSQDDVNKSIASILAGAVFGDHCSPISDTTILSALSSMCSVPTHVATQLPYCVVVGIFAAFCGSLLNGCGLNEWICMPLTFFAIAVFVRLVGRQVPDYRPDQETTDVEEEASRTGDAYREDVPSAPGSASTE